ncbi:polymeric immunoglobulin receptor-like [Sardina pilchardus]|uniref:polymeric immunoglobulin receptor-like n=1 Tax=Sardina pilchardus TaxID=27697 RepID=UPI002E147AFD
MATANSTKGKVTVTDYPENHFFTVTMRNLQPSTDHTHFWCAMSLTETSPYDDMRELSINYQSDPDLSVQRSEVSGEAGGNVSVLCRYSPRYRGEKKRWCRLRDQKCSAVGGFRSPADPNKGWDPQMRHDGFGTLSVEMVGVKQTDSGWYWCEVGDLQRPIYLSVTHQVASMFTSKYKIIQTPDKY